MTNYKLLNYEVYYLSSNIKFDDAPKTIKLPAYLTTDEERQTAVRSWLFYYRSLTFDSTKLDNSYGYIDLNLTEQLFNADDADMITNVYNANTADVDYVEYDLHCVYPNNMITVVDHLCIEYFSANSMYTSPDAVIKQEMFEYLMNFLPVNIWLVPTK